MPDEEDKLDKSKIIDKVYFVYDYSDFLECD